MFLLVAFWRMLDDMSRPGINFGGLFGRGKIAQINERILDTQAGIPTRSLGITAHALERGRKARLGGGQEGQIARRVGNIQTTIDFAWLFLFRLVLFMIVVVRNMLLAVFLAGSRRHGSFWIFFLL